MKTLRSLRVSALALLVCTPLFTNLAHAESPADAALRNRTKQKVTAMLKSLKPPQRIEFSEAQRTKMMSLMQSYRPGSTPPTDAQRKAMQAKFEAILTPAQRKQMAAQRAQTQKTATQTLGWLSTELKLTSAQKAKAQKMIAESSTRGFGGGMGGPGGGRGPGGPGGPGGGDRRPEGGQGRPGGMGGPGGGPGGGRMMGGGRMGGMLGPFFGRRDSFSEILTPAQKSKWEIIKDTAQDTMRSQFGFGRGQGRGGGDRRPGA